jgi:DNA-binding MarR family transcriptional regulator
VLSVTIEKKYVNMTDVIYDQNNKPNAPGRRPHGSTSGESLDREALYEFIELLFFAYRDFVSDPDEILAEIGFGRAHHRVLHFVDRHPGMRVANLLDILKITKQSLGRVLRQLIEIGYVEQKPGPVDRRQRLLFATDKGAQLAQRLADPQMVRIQAALAEMDPGDREIARKFLYLLINDRERNQVRRIVSRI